MTRPVSDFGSNTPENIVEAARVIGRKGTAKHKVFEAVYFGQQQVKGVLEIIDKTGLTEKSVLGAGKALLDKGLVLPEKKNGRTAYRKIRFFAQHKDEVMKLADNPAKRSQVATKRNTALQSSNSSLGKQRYSTPRNAKIKRLRICFLATNPAADLRTDKEMREVTQALRRSKERDHVDIQFFPAAQFSDLLDGLNEMRPNVVHFSGHGGAESIVFDSGDAADPSQQIVDFETLSKAVSATSTPPKLVVLNACSTLDGAEAILDSVQFVVAMSDSILDAAASAFAVQFYSALAAKQPIGHALKQGKSVLSAMGLLDADLPHVICQKGLDPDVETV